MKTSCGVSFEVDAKFIPFLSRFKWKVDKRKGNLAYVYTYLHGKKIPLHRMLLLFSSGFVVDHINRSTLNNKLENLRITDHSGNTHNALRKPGKHNFRGVVSHHGKWTACIEIDGKRYKSYSHETPELAARAYDKMALKYRPETAILNFKDSK